MNAFVVLGKNLKIFSPDVRKGFLLKGAYITFWLKFIDGKELLFSPLFEEDFNRYIEGINIGNLYDELGIARYKLPQISRENLLFAVAFAGKHVMYWKENERNYSCFRIIYNHLEHNGGCFALFNEILYAKKFKDLEEINLKI